jgi:hypothetical protein
VAKPIAPHFTDVGIFIDKDFICLKKNETAFLLEKKIQSQGSMIEKGMGIKSINGSSCITKEPKDANFSLKGEFSGSCLLIKTRVIYNFMIVIFQLLFLLIENG